MRSGCLLLPFSAQFCREPLGRRDACLGIMKAEARCRKVVALNIAAHECSQFYHLDAAVACACRYDWLRYAGTGVAMLSPLCGIATQKTVTQPPLLSPRWRRQIAGLPGSAAGLPPAASA